MTYNRWDIWDAVVPYEEGNGAKKRPVLILDEKTAFVLSLKMTSHSPRYKTLAGEYEIEKWQDAGLSKPTVIQCSKVLRLNSKDFIRQRGRLSQVDIARVQYMLKYYNIIKQ